MKEYFESCRFWVAAVFLVAALAFAGCETVKYVAHDRDVQRALHESAVSVAVPAATGEPVSNSTILLAIGNVVLAVWNAMNSKKIRDLTKAAAVGLLVLFGVADFSGLAAAYAGEAIVDVCFTPGGDCRKQIIAEIDAAKSEVLVLQYVISARPLEYALVRAHQRGVSVLVVADRKQTASSALLQRLRKAGISVKLDAAHCIQHQKLAVIDRQLVIAGSYNWSAAAEDCNAENVLFIRDAATVRRFYGSWVLHDRHSTPLSD